MNHKFKLYYIFYNMNKIFESHQLKFGKLQNFSTEGEDEKALYYVISILKARSNKLKKERSQHDNNSLFPTLRRDGNGWTRLQQQQLAPGDEAAESQSRSAVCRLPRANKKYRITIACGGWCVMTVRLREWDAETRGWDNERPWEWDGDRRRRESQ